jgi:S-formylglutathione hydrolase FrmB
MFESFDPSGPALAAAVVVAILLLAAPAGASAGSARIVTWHGRAVSKSRFVDPSAAPPSFYNEPPGVPERPNALKADVYLPPGYRDHPKRRYPLLFLLHGHGDAYDSWVNRQQGDLLRVAKGFRGIVVMPEADHGWYANWWNGGRRGDPAWERYHLDQLLPVVTRRLRIRRGRRWHAIAGLSMGGEGAIYYASQRPGFFGTAASFSGVLDTQRPEYQGAFEAANGEDPNAVFGDPAAQEFYWAGHNPTALVRNLRATRLFVSVGNGVPDPAIPSEVQNTFGQLAEIELHRMAGDFVAAARAAGVGVSYREHQGIHAWRYWRQDLAAAIGWGLFKRPPAAHRRWTYSTVARVGKAWGLRFRFASPPPVVETLTRAGPILRGKGAGRVVIRSRGCRLAFELPFRASLPHARRAAGC